MPRLRIALCQLNLVVGDLAGNVARILAAYDEAEEAGCDLAAFPELAVCGYPPEDLVLKPGFVADTRAALEEVAARTGRCAAVVGYVDAGRDLYNAAAVLAGGKVRGGTTSGTSPTTPCSTRRARSRRAAPTPTRWSSTWWRACGWASRSARTPGPPTGPILPRRPAAPSWW
jgi:predicted amidohydrolase